MFIQETKQIFSPNSLQVLIMNLGKKLIRDLE
jgi:hypothetical protein